MKKIVCISDSHNLHNNINLPDGDLLIHAGDFSGRGTEYEIKAFNEWLGKIKYKFDQIVIIAGNHDFLFEENSSKARKLITNAVYLQDELFEYNGFKIWGSPISPWFYDWAFNRHRGEDIRKHWDLIPNDIDILITHGPVSGKLDKTKNGMNVGCLDLLNKVNELTNLKLSVCGHIHEAYGKIEENGIHYVNASVCNFNYKPDNQPIVINL